MWVKRTLEEKILEISKSRPALLLTGARQVGKSSLLTKLYKSVDYITLDKVLVAQAAQENPSAFLKQFENQVILDEIQYAPDLFRYIKILIDQNRKNYGKWLLTGSQKFHLMQHISESLAGRIGILNLETLSVQEIRESKKFSDNQLENYLYKGGYPELWENTKLNPSLFFESYIQTYLEKDLRQILNVANLRDFQRFIIACATRIGQLVNFTDIAKDIGVSSVTIKQWVNALESSGIIYLLSPYYANHNKRLIKASKLYFADHGLAAYLLNIESMADWNKSIYKGSVFENMVFSELIKTHDLKIGRNFFFYRDHNNVEVDFLIEKSDEITLIEVKASEIPDRKKLNFKKVLKNINSKKVSSMVACLVDEKNILTYKDYGIYNPIHVTIN